MEENGHPNIEIAKNFFQEKYEQWDECSGQEWEYKCKCKNSSWYLNFALFFRIKYPVKISHSWDWTKWRLIIILKEVNLIAFEILFLSLLLLFNIDNIFFLIENLSGRIFIKQEVNCVNYFKDFNPNFVLNIALKIIRKKWIYNNCHIEIC